jgi:hypothetical protein
MSPRNVRWPIVPAVLVALLAARQPAIAQACYQFSNAQGDKPATVTATFPIAAIPASLVPAGPSIEFTAAFSSYPGLDGTRASYSPLHVATLVDGSTSRTFNTFIVTIARNGSARRLQFDGTDYPLANPPRTFSVFIEQAEGARSNPLPDGLPPTPPPLSAWGARPSSSIDLGHVKLASISFVASCTPRPAAW